MKPLKTEPKWKQLCADEPRTFAWEESSLFFSSSYFCVGDSFILHVHTLRGGTSSYFILVLLCGGHFCTSFWKVHVHTSYFRQIRRYVHVWWVSPPPCPQSGKLQRTTPTVFTVAQTKMNAGTQRRCMLVLK